MDLKKILEQTKSKSEKIKIKRSPVQIATHDRPYTSPIEDKKTNNETKNKSPKDQQQIDNKPTTNQQQINNKSTTNRQQTDNKVIAQPITEVTTNRQQIDNKPTTNCSFSRLVGLQYSVVFFIYQECKKRRSDTTDALTLEYMASYLKATKRTIKTTIYRLEKKGCVLRKEYKSGRGGWTRYELPKEIFHEILQSETDNKPTTKWQQTDNKVIAQPITEVTTTTPSSSNINKIITTTERDLDIDKKPLSENWQSINIAPLSGIGFGQSQLKQLAENSLNTPEVVQESIHHFAFGMQHNSKFEKYTEPLNVLMGVLRKGQGWFENNYESPQDIALRELTERRRAQHQKRTKMLEELLSLEFGEWKDSLNEEDIKSIIPENDTGLYKNTMMQDAALRTHFQKHLWPSIKAKLP